MDDLIDLRHLRREVRTALELAVVALAPSELADRLATAAGLLEALIGLPADCAPAITLTPRARASGKQALADWRAWQTVNADRRVARG